MGQIQNITYTAPDGSVYRVEADGSVTKIKGGRVQSNEPPSKYQISPDGKIYRVESDGSVTYLGNAEDRQSPNHYATNTPNNRKNHKWVWVLIILCSIVFSLMFFKNRTYSSSNNHHGVLENENEFTAYSGEEVPVVEEKNFFSKITVFNGGDQYDDYIQMIFYPNGKCTEYNVGGGEAFFCLCSYYIILNHLYIKYEDSRTMLLDIDDDSIQYGRFTLKRTQFNHISSYFSKPTCFEGYTDTGEKKEAKYYTDGRCKLTDYANNEEKTGTYKFSDGLIKVEWLNGLSESYYFNTEAYVHNNVFFWIRRYFDEDE